MPKFLALIKVPCIAPLFIIAFRDCKSDKCSLPSILVLNIDSMVPIVYASLIL